MFKPRRRRTDPFATLMFAWAIVLGMLACIEVSRGGDLVNALLVLGFGGALYGLGAAIGWAVGE